MTGFADRLEARADAVGAPLCVGVDPFPDLIPEAVFGPQGSPRAIAAWALALIETAAPFAAAIKPQLGLFEPFGPDGVAAAQEACAAARAVGAPVILDAKRGDIGSTAEGYARAALGPAPGFDADCVTVNPYLGLDALQPFLDAAAVGAKGVAVLVRTSNPGAADFQDLMVDGAPLWTRVAERLRPACASLIGECGYSSLMVVAGATYPEEARRLRTILPHALFLVPGYGAQGASATDAAAGFADAPGRKRGGVINASRAVAYPQDARAARTLDDWRAAVRAAAAAAHGAIKTAVTKA